MRQLLKSCKDVWIHANTSLEVRNDCCQALLDLFQRLRLLYLISTGIRDDDWYAPDFGTFAYGFFDVPGPMPQVALQPFTKLLRRNFMRIQPFAHYDRRVNSWKQSRLSELTERQLIRDRFAVSIPVAQLFLNRSIVAATGQVEYTILHESIAKCHYSFFTALLHSVSEMEGDTV